THDPVKNGRFAHIGPADNGGYSIHLGRVMPVNCGCYKLRLDKGGIAGYEPRKLAGVMGGVCNPSFSGFAMVRLYIGNLSFKATEEDLRASFACFGEVAATRIVKHPASGRSLGFAFVDMPVDADARRAATALHNQPVA